jgi:alpha-ribazole phosphatase
MRVAALHRDKALTPTRLYLMRHGQVAEGHTDRYHGHNDVDLSETGRRQFESLAGHLQAVDLAAIYCSDLHRTREGARLLATGRELAPQPCPEFRELCFGVWEGLTLAEIAQRYPRELEARFRDLTNFRIPGGESLADVRARVIPKLQKILAAHPGQTIALVAHAGVNRVILCEALHLPFSQIFRLDQTYGCLNIIDYFPDFSLVRLLNGGVNGAG